MKIKFLFLLLSLNITFSQPNYFELKSIKKNEIQLIETKFESCRAKRIMPFKSENNDELAMQFSREKTGIFPAATVKYFSSPNDSVVKSIIFYWKLNIVDRQFQSEKIEKYNTEFDNLVLAISNELGNPIPNQGKIEHVESFVDNDPTPNYQRKII
jgi:hypothetical protein